jgi:hypothetical protein
MLFESCMLSEKKVLMPGTRNFMPTRFQYAGIGVLFKMNMGKTRMPYRRKR